MSEIWSKINSEQKQRAFIIQEKWLKISKSTERINYQTAIDGINAAYFAVGVKKAPEILFFESPYAIWQSIQKKVQYNKKSSFSLYRRLKIEFVIKPRNSIRYQLNNWPTLNNQPDNQKHPSCSWSMAQISLLSRVSIQFWARYAWWLDFAYSVLGCYHVSEKWEGLQLLVKNCGFIIPFNDICFVSDRPIELSFKQDMILHAEGKPAVLFSDGYQMFAYGGVELSIKY